MECLFTLFKNVSNFSFDISFLYFVVQKYRNGQLTNLMGDTAAVSVRKNMLRESDTDILIELKRDITIHYKKKNSNR